MPQTNVSSAEPRSGWLEVGHGHRLWYECGGAADGIPVLLLHGGPGSGSTPRQAAFFDAARYRTVRFDQRGCGRSTPAGETAHNHTDALVADIEALRVHVGVARWLVAGGSWGSALALAYAARHRERVLGLLLRGVFLTGRADLDWFFHGVAALAPQAHADFLAHVPRRWRRRAVTWLERCFREGDDERRQRVALAWQVYEARLDNFAAAPSSLDALDAGARARLVAKYRVQSHYLARRCFLGEAALWRAAGALSGVPLAIVHGTADRICLPRNAWRVQRACAGSRLAWAPGAGHDPWHPAVSALLRGAAAAFASDGDFSAWAEGKEAAR